ncbi:MAG: hypothetical protein WCL44_14655, partial [bacterium]
AYAGVISGTGGKLTKTGTKMGTVLFMSPEQVKGSELRNLTNREVDGQILFTRACYWTTKGVKAVNQKCLDLSRAHHLSPGDPNIAAFQKEEFDYYGIKPEDCAIDIQPTE